MEHRIEFTPEQKARIIEEMAPEALRTGFAHGVQFTTDQQLTILHKERRLMRPNMVLNKIAHLFQYWEGEEINPTYHPVRPSLRGKKPPDRINTMINQLSGTPRFLMPGAVSFGDQLAITIQEAGRTAGIRSFQKWTCDNIYMTNNAIANGYLASVGEHTDADTELLSGLRVIASLGSVSVIIGGSTVEVNEADIEVFICSDAASEAGIQLQPHSVLPIKSRAAFIFDSFPK